MVRYRCPMVAKISFASDVTTGKIVLHPSQTLGTQLFVYNTVTLM